MLQSEESEAQTRRWLQGALNKAEQAPAQGGQGDVVVHSAGQMCATEGHTATSMGSENGQQRAECEAVRAQSSMWDVGCEMACW